MEDPSVPPWVLADWVLMTPLKGPIGSEPLFLNPGLLVSDSLAARIAARSRAPQTAPSILKKDGETGSPHERPGKRVRWCEHALGEAQDPSGEVSVERPRGACGGDDGRWRGASRRVSAARWWGGSGGAWSEAGAWGGRAGSWSWRAAWGGSADTWPRAAAEASDRDGSWWRSSGWWEAAAGRAEPAASKRSAEWWGTPPASPREPWAGSSASRGPRQKPWPGGDGPGDRCGDVAGRGGGRSPRQAPWQTDRGDHGARSRAAGWWSDAAWAGSSPGVDSNSSSGRGGGARAHGTCSDRATVPLTCLKPATKRPLREWADNESKPASELQYGGPAEGSVTDATALDVYVNFGGQGDALAPAGKAADRLGVDFEVEICAIATGRSLVTLKTAAASRGEAHMSQAQEPRWRPDPGPQQGGRDDRGRWCSGTARSPKPLQGRPRPAAGHWLGEARAAPEGGPDGDGETWGSRLWSGASGALRSQ